MNSLVITTLAGLVLAAYGWIFNVILRRISKVERKQESSDLCYLEIKTALAQIQTDLKWIKERKVN